MLPNDRAQPAAPDKPSWGARLLHAYRQYPLWVKVVIAIAAIPFAELILLAALVYGIVAVTQGRRTVGASIAVALWGLTVFSFAYKDNRTWLYSVILLPFAVVLAAHAKPLARSFVPCRTVAWVLAWSVPAGVIAFKAAPAQPVVGYDAAQLAISDPSGSPVSGLSLSIVPWMPAHGHGTSVNPTVTETAPGIFVATPLYLFMPGSWELRMTIAGSVDDTAKAAFEIP